ncbi:MAG: hypothetical protein KDB23_24270 [Planctomycetales bacterium]|nr:hypothetical protein [Planctomycetales bacterium]
MRNLIGVAFLGALAIVSLLGANVLAAVFQPTGVSPGSTYHLLFTTDGVRDGTASEFSDYVGFVNDEASRSGLTRDVEWLPIVSLLGRDGSAELNAQDLVPVSGPIYTLGGQLFSDVGLFSQTPMATPNVDQFGHVLNVSWSVATGTDGNGVAQDPLPSTFISVGTNFDLNDDGWIVDDDEPSSQLYHFYAVSHAIVAVPEPGFNIVQVAFLFSAVALAQRCRERKVIT